MGNLSAKSPSSLPVCPKRRNRIQAQILEEEKFRFRRDAMRRLREPISRRSGDGAVVETDDPETEVQEATGSDVYAALSSGYGHQYGGYQTGYIKEEECPEGE